MAASESRGHLRLVRDPEPLGSYIRPLERDFRLIEDLLAVRRSIGTGLILDARDPSRSAELRDLARESGIEVCLDPNAVELSTPSGFERSRISSLPWAGNGVDSPESLARRMESFTSTIATTAVDMRVDSVLVPTHFLDSFPSQWFDLDLRLTRALRASLNEVPLGCSIRLHYPLVSRLVELTKEPVRQRVIAALRQLAVEGSIDAIFMRMHGFGTTTSGRLTLRRYVRVARDLHKVGLPIVGERTGTIGLALLALGCVSGIESGVTHGDRCDIRSLQRPPKKDAKGFAPAPRVYLPAIGVFLNRDPARQFFGAPGIKNWFACQAECCKNGHVDMIADPRRHFLVTRSNEVNHIGVVPMEIRSENYLNKWLRPASDRAIRAARVLPDLSKHRDRLDAWRETVSEIIYAEDRSRRPSVAPILKSVVSSEKSSGTVLTR